MLGGFGFFRRDVCVGGCDDLEWATTTDLVGVAIVYLYVAGLLVFTEKVVAKRYPILSRKVLHIMVGNVAFLLPIFQTRWMMAFVTAGPFILFTFLMSPYSPISKMRGKTSEAGHGMGLVYYAISWTVLAYFFFESKEIIAIGILAMSYGDGFASLIGMRYGKKAFRVFDDVKSYVGSFAMFCFTFLMMNVALLFYSTFSFSHSVCPFCLESEVLLLSIAFVAALAEAVTPKGLDNLSVPFLTAFLYFLTLAVV